MSKKDFKKFAFDMYPNLKSQYKLYCMSDKELIGTKVVSIRSGFSGNAGTKCYISEIKPPFKGDLQSPEYDRINFLGRDGYEKNSELGWQVLRKELYSSVKLDE